jgi:hypothetical protein
MRGHIFIQLPDGIVYFEKLRMIVRCTRQLPLIRVLELIREDYVLQKCVLGLKECSEEKPCPLHNRYKKIKPELVRMFESVSVHQLSKDLRKGMAIIGNKQRTSRTA